MSYDKVFDPPMSQVLAGDGHVADRRDGAVYVYSDEIVLAINVALVTGRPLLLRGPPGCGKSTLAPAVARVLGWRYYEHVVSSRTAARDLLWSFDALRRLSDAQAGGNALEAVRYVEPGVLWWAFDQTSAECRGLMDSGSIPRAVEPGAPRKHDRAVVLIDEIDKADPDVPNNLLIPFGSLEFMVEETGCKVTARCVPLLMITTNDERDLPRAFLRRCIILNLPAPTEERLMEIAAAHFGSEHATLCSEAIQAISSIAARRAPGQPWHASAAEFLDTIRACLQMSIHPGSPEWQRVAEITLFKDQSREGARI